MYRTPTPAFGRGLDPVDRVAEDELRRWAHSHLAEEEAGFDFEECAPYPVAVCRVEDRDPNEIVFDEYMGCFA